MTRLGKHQSPCPYLNHFEAECGTAVHRIRIHCRACAAPIPSRILRSILRGTLTLRLCFFL